MGVSTSNQPVGRCKRCRLFVWNPERRAFCTKTGTEWVQTCFYYCGFYCILVLICVVFIFMILLYFGHYHAPWWELGADGSSSDVTVFPTQKSLQYDALNRVSQNRQIKKINEFLKDYQNQDSSKHQDCTKPTQVSTAIKPCSFDTSSLGPCGKEPYGYDSSTPCMLIKPNKAFGWPHGKSGSPLTRSKKLSANRKM